MQEIADSNIKQPEFFLQQELKMTNINILLKKTWEKLSKNFLRFSKEDRNINNKSRLPIPGKFDTINLSHRYI